MDKLITEKCYNDIRSLYIKEEFLLYEFPCRCIPPVPVAGVTLRGVYWRIMDVETPPEVDKLWEYAPSW